MFDELRAGAKLQVAGLTVNFVYASDFFCQLSNGSKPETALNETVSARPARRFNGREAKGQGTYVIFC